jgi:hypothetical protein
MNGSIQTNVDASRDRLQGSQFGAVHPAWLRLMEYCAELKYGELQNLKIQDGLPVVAEVTMKKVKFSP